MNTQYECDITTLLKLYLHRVTAYVLCSTEDSSLNVAVSLCALHRSSESGSGPVAVGEDLQPLMDSLKIPLLLDVRGKTEDWLWDQHLPGFNSRVVQMQLPASALVCLSDYGVMAGAFQFYTDSADDPLVQKVFGSMQPLAAVTGWGPDEFTVVATASRNAALVNGSDHAYNLSVFSAFNAPLQQRTHSTPAVLREAVHTVTFLFTDGDNVQWLLNNFATDARWFGSPARGQAPVGWTLSPAMAELAPTVMRRFYEMAANTAQGKDYFVGGVSGLGYIYPDLFKSPQDFANYANLTAAVVQKADLRIVNVIGTDFNPSTLQPLLTPPQVDAVLYYDYSNYCLHEGEIRWSAEHKPIITGRYALWQPQFETPESLAAKLNALPRDPRTAAGYSLIPVHAWSMNVADVLRAISLLEPQGVRVTQPDEFVDLITRFVRS